MEQGKQLLESISQHLINELAHIQVVHQQVGKKPKTLASLTAYYQAVGSLLDRCRALRQSLDDQEDPNDRIGRYLVEARKEAEGIILKAREEAQAYQVGRLDLEQAPEGDSSRLVFSDERDVVEKAHLVPQNEEAATERDCRAALQKVESNRAHAISSLTKWVADS